MNSYAEQADNTDIPRNQGSYKVYIDHLDLDL